MTHLCRLQEALGKEARKGAQRGTVQADGVLRADPLSLAAILHLLPT